MFPLSIINTVQKMKFPIKDAFSKCDQIRRNLRSCYLLKKFLMEDFIFLCSVKTNKQFFLSPEVKLKALFVVAFIVVVAF